MNIYHSRRILHILCCSIILISCISCDANWDLIREAAAQRQRQRYVVTNSYMNPGYGSSFDAIMASFPDPNVAAKQAAKQIENRVKNGTAPVGMPVSTSSYESSNQTSTSNSSSSGGSSTSYTADCHICHGSGKCKTCYGEHRYINPLTGKYVTCPNCRPGGACTYCGGTGKKR